MFSDDFKKEIQKVYDRFGYMESTNGQIYLHGKLKINLPEENSNILKISMINENDEEIMYWNAFLDLIRTNDIIFGDINIAIPFDITMD